MEDLVERIFAVSSDIRYVAVYRNGQPRSWPCRRLTGVPRQARPCGLVAGERG
jgi:hypothetical protein